MNEKTYALLVDNFDVTNLDNNSGLMKDLFEVIDIFNLCGIDLVIASKVSMTGDTCPYRWWYYDGKHWTEMICDNMNVSMLYPIVDSVIIDKHYHDIDMDRDDWYKSIKRIVVEKYNYGRTVTNMIKLEDYTFPVVEDFCKYNDGYIISNPNKSPVLDHLILTDDNQYGMLGALITDLQRSIKLANLSAYKHSSDTRVVDLIIKNNHKPIILIRDYQFSDPKFMKLLYYYIQKSSEYEYTIGLITAEKISWNSNDIMIDTIKIDDHMGDGHPRLSGHEFDITSSMYSDRIIYYTSDDVYLNELVKRKVKISSCSSKLYEFIKNFRRVYSTKTKAKIEDKGDEE